MIGPTQTRQIGQACRIYKNSDAKVLAIDEITVTADTRRIDADTFHRSASLQSSRTLLHLAVGNRVIDSIQMIGDYTSITEDAGDYLIATWEDTSGSANDVNIGFGDLKKLGESV